MDPEANDQVRGALARSGFAAVQPGEEPRGEALWAAVGGTRGLVEALLPGLSFLMVYTLTQNLLWSVAAPTLFAIGFILARLVTKTPVMSAVAGLIGIAASAGVALFSGRAEDNFLLGFVVNGLWIFAIVVSLILRKPLVGVLAVLLTGDSSWREDPASRRVSITATWMWLGVFAGRLGVQLPLYFAGAVSQLALAKLLMGIPLYAAALWITWLLMRAVHRGKELAAK